MTITDKKEILSNYGELEYDFAVIEHMLYMRVKSIGVTYRLPPGCDMNTIKEKKHDDMVSRLYKKLYHVLRSETT